MTTTDDLPILEAEAEPETPTVAALATITPGDALVRPAASIHEVEDAFHDYQALCARLLDHDDIQHIGGRSFRKKSAWRKLAVAFGVSCEVRERIYDRNDQGQITRAEVIVRATAPNGRYMDGLGVCDLSERKFSKPQHDIPATAMTRATNRACADLFGMGEVSAEEITDDRHAEAPRSPGKTPRARDLRAAPGDAQARAAGYESAAALNTEMSRLLETLSAMPTESRDAFKSARKAAGIAWPIPQADLERTWAIVANLPDLEAPF